MAISGLLFSGLTANEERPIRIVGGEGSTLFTDEGRRMLDGANTGGPLGHRHPDMVAAIRRAADDPVVNDGLYWLEREEAANDLLEKAFAGEHEWVGAVRFFLSGSEANDMALSLAQALTGRRTLATRERAYHGMTGLARDMTVQPHWHGGLSHADGTVQPVPPSAPVVQIPAPPFAPRIGPEPSGTVAEVLAGAEQGLSDAAALIVDYTQGGIYYSSEYQDAAADAARAAGALWIADEVVTGLGRSGRWFAFQGGERRPDIVTLGKPLAGGATPAGAVVVSQEVLERMGDSNWQTFSTFRGHPLMIAATREYLRLLEREQLLDRVAGFDGRMLDKFSEIADRHPGVRSVDGRGLHWTVELSGPDWRDWDAATSETPLATRIAGRAAEAGVMIGTSGERTSVFVAPPLNIHESDLDRVLEALDYGLELADVEVADRV